MSVLALHRPAWGVLRHSTWDVLLVALAVGHGLLLCAVPAWPVIALGVWWNSNTIAHYFIHRPFFASPGVNAVFALYQSVLLGVPQTLWRERHLAHHAGVGHRWRWSRSLVVECSAVVLLWASLAVAHPGFFLKTYLPGFGIGLLLCGLHGYYEHAHGTVSHHGRLYNLLFFNDGFHVEHHAHPGEHWTRLPGRATSAHPVSRWPAVLRWLDALSLDGLERLVLRSPRLQRFVLRRHEAAFRNLLPEPTAIRRVTIVGGGLFPRTLLVLKKLLPDAAFVVLDASAHNLESGKSFLRDGVEWRHQWYAPEAVRDCDLVVFPLAFRGDRRAIYREPPAPLVVVHDWLWRPRGSSCVVSLFLCKRLNLVTS